jgi:hypothetical protein
MEKNISINKDMILGFGFTIFEHNGKTAFGFFRTDKKGIQKFKDGFGPATGSAFNIIDFALDDKEVIYYLTDMPWEFFRKSVS